MALGTFPSSRTSAGSAVFLVASLLLVSSPLSPVLRAAALIGDSTCSSIVATHNDALNACNVTDIGQLHRNILYMGAPMFCVSDCISAVDALFEDIKYCDDADALLGTSDIYSQTQEVFFAQAQCAAPSLECMVVMREFTRWLRSDGRTCYATLLGGPRLADNPSSQTQLESLCTGSCNDGFSHYFDAFHTEECHRWRGYQVFRQQYRLSCTTSEGTYCRNQFNPEIAAPLLVTARNLSLSDGERNAALTSLCTPCFYQHINAARLENFTPTSLAELEILCVEDQGTFCYTDFTATLDASASVFPLLRFQRLCSLGVCNEKMLAFIAQYSSAAPAEAAVLVDDAASHLAHMCVANEINATCVDVVDNVFSGFDNSLEFQGVPYHGPSQCSAIEEGDYCAWGCQRRLRSQQEEGTCCFRSVKSYFPLIGTSGAELSTATTDIETVADECTSTYIEACNRFNMTEEVRITVPFPYKFLRVNLDRLIQDISVLSGRPIDTIDVPHAGYISEFSSLVVIEFQFESPYRAYQFLSGFEQLMMSDSVAFSRLTPAYRSWLNLFYL